MNFVAKNIKNVKIQIRMRISYLYFYIREQKKKQSPRLSLRSRRSGNVEIAVVYCYILFTLHAYGPFVAFAGFIRMAEFQKEI